MLSAQIQQKLTKNVKRGGHLTRKCGWWEAQVECALISRSRRRQSYKRQQSGMGPLSTVSKWPGGPANNEPARRTECLLIAPPWLPRLLGFLRNILPTSVLRACLSDWTCFCKRWIRLIQLWGGRRRAQIMSARSIFASDRPLPISECRIL